MTIDPEMRGHTDTGGGAGGDAMANDEGTAFRNAYKGRLTGLLSWDDVAVVFATVRTEREGWWIYDTRGAVPNAPVASDRLADRIVEVETFLRSRHRADYCGFVYVDDKALPKLIKVFDPRNASACSLGSPVPTYTVSRLRPVALPLVEDASHDTGSVVEAAGGSGGLVRRILKRLT